MVPANFTNFFVASAGAGAALVGLLFVAVSIAPEQIVSATAPVERRALATSAFTALLNGFFISLGALIPGNMGWLTLVVSIAGVLNSLSLGWNLLKERQNWASVARRLFLMVGSLVLYGFEVYYAVLIMQAPTETGGIYLLAWLLLGIYGLGLLRAWQLLGARRYGILSWLSPLHEVKELPPVSESGKSDSVLCYGCYGAIRKAPELPSQVPDSLKKVLTSNMNGNELTEEAWACATITEQSWCLLA